MDFKPPDYIAIIAAVIACVSALFAWQSAKASRKAYSVQLIGQLYTLYQSEEMLNNLQVVGRSYIQLWVEKTNSPDEAKANANNGILLPADVAERYFNGLEDDSLEFKAIHYLINYWTYLELLLKNKSLNEQEIRAFTSPYLLGFLLPMAEAYDKKFPSPIEYPALKFAYDKLVSVKRRRWWALSSVFC